MRGTPKNLSEKWLLLVCIGIICVAVYASMLGRLARAITAPQLPSPVPLPPRSDGKGCILKYYVSPCLSEVARNSFDVLWNRAKGYK